MGLERDVLPFLDDAAPELVRCYYGGSRFTGRRFEFLGGGGDRRETKDVIAADDLVALSLLSIELPGEAALEILEERAGDINSLLGQIPTTVSLTEPGALGLIGKGSAADRTWALFRGIPGIGPVTAHKLMARKRPHLLPVYDKVVKAALQPTRTDFWRPLWETLQDEVLVHRLEQVRVKADVPDVSLLRVLDVAVWMRNWGTAKCSSAARRP